MTSDPDPRERETSADPAVSGIDAAALKDAHGRTGRMLKTAGLPFEDEEFEEAGAAETSDGEPQ